MTLFHVSPDRLNWLMASATARGLAAVLLLALLWAAIYWANLLP